MALGRTPRTDAAGEPITCTATFTPADPAEQAVLESTMVLPASVIDAAREALRRRLDVPRDGLVDRQRQRQQVRLDQLRKQHEWGDIADDDYRAARADTHAQLAPLPMATSWWRSIAGGGS